MLSQKNRFSTWLFDRCFKKSKKTNIGPFIFLVSESRIPISHFSVVVGKKYSKHAVKRNRLRRQIYELIRKIIVPKMPGKNVICLYKGNQNEQTSKDLERYFYQFLRVLQRPSVPPKRAYRSNR